MKLSVLTPVAAVVALSLGWTTSPASSVAAVGQQQQQQQQGRTATCVPDRARAQRNQQMAGAMGAVAGALLGNRLGLGSGQGQNLGRQLGASFGGFLDSCDQQQASSAAQEALNGAGGRQVAWTSTNNQGVRGSAQVTRQRQTPDGETCRTVAEIAYKDGEEVQEEVEYCRVDGGGWVRST